MERISNEYSNKSNMSEYQSKKLLSSKSHEQSESPPSSVIEETGWRTVQPGERKQELPQNNNTVSIQKSSSSLQNEVWGENQAATQSVSNGIEKDSLSKISEGIKEALSDHQYMSELTAKESGETVFLEKIDNEELYDAAKFENENENLPRSTSQEVSFDEQYSLRSAQNTYEDQLTAPFVPPPSTVLETGWRTMALKSKSDKNKQSDVKENEFSMKNKPDFASNSFTSKPNADEIGDKTQTISINKNTESGSNIQDLGSNSIDNVSNNIVEPDDTNQEFVPPKNEEGVGSGWTTYQAK